MDRNDVLLVGLGGGGGRLTDSLVEQNPLFQQFYINTSITDIEALDHSNKETKNYFVISNVNGMGRNRELGKRYAEQYGYNIIDTLEKYQQNVIYLISSFGGGSGSSILSTILRAIDDMREDGYFQDKIINVIGILPSISSPEIILSNCKDTWNEVLQCKCVSSMIFVDNNSNIIDTNSTDEKELEINRIFADNFDSIFDIPLANGVNFDTGNLGNILTNKGCLYFYNLDDDCTSIDIAFSKAKSTSVLPNMFINELNTIVDSKGSTQIKCGYLGLSFENEKYNKNFILNKYISKHETYIGKNEDRNLVLISGCYPPYDAITLIDHELKERKETKSNDDLDFSSFVSSTPVSEETNIDKADNETQSTTQTKKRKLKKGLFKR